MTRWLGLVELATLAALAFAALAVAATAALWPLVRQRLRSLHPERASRLVLGLATAPAWAPAAGLALCLLPGVLGGAGLGDDHCPRHGGHAHLCLLHPAASQPVPAAALLGAAALGTLLPLLRDGRSLARARRALAGLPAERAAWGARLVESEAALSLTLGVLRPEIVLSRGLVSALAPEGLACVLAHERAHARRRDALRGVVARACSWLHPPRVRRALLRELRLAAERACDEAAARAGERLVVAETILAVERLARSRPPSGAGAAACAFGESDVAARVEALLGEPPRAPRRSAAAACAAACAGLALAAAGPLHHAVEHLLGALLRLF